MGFPPSCVPAAARRVPCAVTRALAVKRPRPPASAVTRRACVATAVQPCEATHRKVRLYDARGAPVAYDSGWRWQHALVRELKDDAKATDALILLEHEAVYTLGTRSELSHVLFDATPAAASAHGATLVRTERGGEVTYHAPGQLVAYPVMNLSRAPLKRDLHWYLRTLEGVVIALCARYGIDAQRRPGRAGVWVGHNKIAAIGLKVSKWITMHGIALNVDLDLAPFSKIVPCGLSDAGVTSLTRLLAHDAPSMHVVRDDFAAEFAIAFGPLRFRNTLDPRFMPLRPPHEHHLHAVS